MSKNSFGFTTKLVHAGEPDPRIEGAVSMPIFQSSTYEYSGEEQYDDIRYIRLNNTPNHKAIQKKLAAIECAESALVTSSGMSAITATLLTFLKQGDHLLSHKSLYGGTASFILEDLPRYGITFDLIDTTDPSGWSMMLKPNTKVIYAETITNPMLDVPELGAIVDFAKENNLISMIDNTFASPVLFSPAELGFDISLHSCTKYINGHSDIVAGAVIGSDEFIKIITSRMNHFGGSLNPGTCFLLHRAIKTLELRMIRQSKNAGQIALFLENHPEILSVNYPGLVSNNSYERAKKYLSGFSAMVSFEVVGGKTRSIKFMDQLDIAINAPSLGGVETLITRPALSSHSGMDPAERVKAGITDSLIRLSVGIESVDDLITDLDQALIKTAS
ncbi:MAG: cystathionine beta-lyase [Candidatus Marinimicrobia bacterium]|nr:cystathionine beta-lyase [Candidatus Neomarinimicrobiota bacterium]|tara:strand:+ start:1861 stop:3027 length:1167 start_codon:yes stop_codon:yes gene_type:complete